MNLFPSSSVCQCVVWASIVRCVPKSGLVGSVGSLASWVNDSQLISIESKRLGSSFVTPRFLKTKNGHYIFF
jgi:hypothetical protein